MSSRNMDSCSWYAAILVSCSDLGIISLISCLSPSISLLYWSRVIIVDICIAISEFATFSLSISISANCFDERQASSREISALTCSL